MGSKKPLEHHHEGGLCFKKADGEGCVNWIRGPWGHRNKLVDAWHSSEGGGESLGAAGWVGNGVARPSC